MSIKYDEQNKLFHLKTSDTSYVLQVFKKGYLMHVYYGAAVADPCTDDLISYEPFSSFSPKPEQDDKSFSLDAIPREYPAYGNTDFRTPAFQIALENGTRITDLKYAKHNIYSGKPAIEGLPATYCEDGDKTDTLEIVLKDEIAGLSVVLYYSVLEDYNVITRSAKLMNDGKQELKLLSALSMSMDFYNDTEFELMHLHGSWARERQISRIPIGMSHHVVDSKRGASSHQQNPFMALLRKNTDEDQGEVYAFNLVYSGSFIGQVEASQYNSTRVSMGINSFDFGWVLNPSEVFHTPEVVMVYSKHGLNAMSNKFHRLYRERLCRGLYRDKQRPILINNWEATYFDFNEEKIESIAKAASELGIELFVLDDGWFGTRNSDESSLGDWYVNKKKLPGGLERLAQTVNQMDMSFGLWVEPEMISPDSELYRNHPDWCLQVPNRSQSEGRNQLVLDLSREDVCTYLVDVLSSVLSSAHITYVKWDMNRHMTEVGSLILPPERQSETAHRYMLGLYHVMETLVSKFSDILFESCSGGGGRFDPGMLYYMPQTWTSDNTDAISRLYIQYGTSLVYPPVTMGSHVSDVPNHQVGRTTSLKTRAITAMAGNFGYELDAGKLTEIEKDEIKEQIKLYKAIRPMVQFGDFYRLLNPFEGNRAAWMAVSKDQLECVVYYYRILKQPNLPAFRLKLRGLNETVQYQLLTTDKVYYGDDLMHRGIAIPHYEHDFSAVLIRLKALE